jgi:hypothetical protein
MKPAGVLPIVALTGLGGLFGCSFLFELNGLEGAGGSGPDATDPGSGDAGREDTMAVGTGDEGDLDVGDGGSGDVAAMEEMDAPAASPDGGRPDGVAFDAMTSDAVDANVGDRSAPDATGADADAAPPTEGGEPDADGGDPLAVGLVAYYRFDETGGTTSADATGHGHTAMMNGATFAAGLDGNAATMSGSAQYVSFPSSIVAGLTSFSFALWAKVSAAPDGGAPVWTRIFDFGTGTSVYMFLTPNSTNSTLRYATTTGGNTQEQRLDAPPLPTGAWEHVAITLAGTTGTLYVNGVQAMQNTAMTLNPSSLGTTTQVWVGRSEFAMDPYLTGQVDNFRIYSRALSPSEVMRLVQQSL